MEGVSDMRDKNMVKHSVGVRNVHVSIGHDALLGILGTRVDDIVFNSYKAGRLLSLHDLGTAERLVNS